MRSITIALLLISTSACAPGMQLASDYDWVKQQEFPYQGINWQVMDRPQESRLMIRPPLGQMWGEAAEAGVTFSDVKPTSAPQRAAEAWLKAGGRSCETLGVDPVGEIARQIRYKCS